jgi:hypothetical protein
MKRFTPFIFSVLLSAHVIAQTALPPAVSTQLTQQVTADLQSAGISAGATVSVSGYAPLAIAAPPSVIASAPQTADYYVSTTGDDAADGRTAATAWRTPKVVDNKVVYLTGGQKFAFSNTAHLDFSGHVHATVTSDPANPAYLVEAADGANNGIIESWANGSGCTLSNVILDSADGKGFGGNIRGPGWTVSNVLFNNLGEGLHFINGCTGLKITGGGQIGSVAGRCIFILDTTDMVWTGDPARHYGPAAGQSPIRFSEPGAVRGVISGVTATQLGSPFPIAAWAIHQAAGTKLINDEAIGGSFSFDTAGGQDANDTVTGCTVSGLTTINATLELHAASHKNTFTGCTLQNASGACITNSGSTGDVISNCAMASPVGGVHFYSPSDAVIKDCTLDTQGHAAAKLIVNGAAGNDGGGNVVK